MNKPALVLSMLAALVVTAAPPAIGDKAPLFSLPSLRGPDVRLSDVLAKGPVALIVLRGFPGYQCPVCNRQVQELVKSAKGFAEAGARVLMVYPGPRDKAVEFAADKSLPSHFDLLLDGDYTFTNQYGLRWNAPNETAYPSTFVLSRDGVVRFQKVSSSHGGRTNAADVLKALESCCK